MAHTYDEVGNPIPHSYDEGGNPIPEYDEFSNPHNDAIQAARPPPGQGSTIADFLRNDLRLGGSASDRTSTILEQILSRIEASNPNDTIFPRSVFESAWNKQSGQFGNWSGNEDPSDQLLKIAAQTPQTYDDEAIRKWQASPTGTEWNRQGTDLWNKSQEDEGFFGSDIGKILMLAAAVYSGGSALGAWGGGSGAAGLAGAGADLGMFNAGVGGAGAIGGTGAAAATGALSGLDLGMFNAAPGGAGAIGGTGEALAGAGALGGNMDWLTELLQQTGEYGVDASSLESGFNAAGSASPSFSTPSWLDDLLKETGEFGVDAASLESGFNPAAVPGVLESLWNTVTNLPKGAVEAGKAAFKLLAGGDTAGGLNGLLKAGLPLAMLAGLFEKNNNPLTGSMVNAAQGALSAADRFAALPSIPLTASQNRAITTANTNVGNWQPYVDKASQFADTAAGGVTPDRVNALMNPYIDQVLGNSIRDIEEAAERRRQVMRQTSNMSGNDAFVPGSNTPTRFQVEGGLLDRDTLRTIGDVSATTRAGAYNTALGTAGSDLNRILSASGTNKELAGTVGALGQRDVSLLTGAGALERLPLEDERAKLADTSTLYSRTIPGTASAATAAQQPSMLGQAAGALGAYNAATKLGIV